MQSKSDPPWKPAVVPPDGELPATSAAAECDKSILGGVVERLNSGEPATKAGLFVLAVASGYYNFLGARTQLAANGLTLLTQGAAAVFAVAVVFAIYLFWSNALDLIPRMQTWPKRLAMLAVVLFLGNPGVMAISSWFNAIALFGTAALEQHLAHTVVGYTAALDDANRRARQVRQLLPKVVAEEGRYRSLAECERAAGCLTGVAGEGAIVSSLTQVADQLAAVSEVIGGWADTNDALVADAAAQLASMRNLIHGRDSIDQRSARFADAAVKLDVVLARLNEETVVPAIRRTAETLDKSFIKPATSGRRGLGDQQDEVMESIKAQLKDTGTMLAAMAQEMEGRVAVEAHYEPLNAALAVLVYARDFVPGWAAAISIDLLPFVLLLFLMVAHAAARQR